MKRVPPPETSFLERDEISSLFALLPSKGRYALRDRTLFLFLYNTGARLQEAVDLRVGGLDPDASPWVRVHGKGDKWSTCPLWGDTANLLKTLLRRRPMKSSSEERRPRIRTRCSAPERRTPGFESRTASAHMALL